MTNISMARRLTGEGLGTGLLLSVVIGSGIMGDRLAGGNDAVALLGNTIATGVALVVLITIFAPVSGAHFNPAVTLIVLIKREIDIRTALAYAIVQVVGGILGVWAAHAMFDETIIQVSSKLRDGPAQMFGEFIATFGLIATILGTLRARPEVIATNVGLYITAAYWFTSSTSFANPAVTVARALSNTFAGIAPASAPGFIVAQFAGALGGYVVFSWLLRHD